MTKMIKSLVIGKFYPFHKGHEYLIRTALESSNKVYVVVLGRYDEDYSPFRRADWIEYTFLEECSSERLIVKAEWDNVDEDYESDSVWQAHVDIIKSTLGDEVIDYVYSSEDYGDRLATYFDAISVIVDKARTTIPISGTAIRNDLSKNFKYLTNPAKWELSRKIVIVGGESSGKTTLAKALASHFETKPVLEYGREWVERQIANGTPLDKIEWDDEIFDMIARYQTVREWNAIEASESLYTVCDTDAFATEVWRDRYLGTNTAYQNTQHLIQNKEYKIPYLFVVPDINEVAFEDDGTRDGALIRHEMHQYFINLINTFGFDLLLVNGSTENRVKQIVDYLGTK